MTLENHFKKNAGTYALFGLLTIATGYHEAAANIPDTPSEIQRLYQIERELKREFSPQLNEEMSRITSSPTYRVAKSQYQKDVEDACQSLYGGLSLCLLGLIPASFGIVYLFDKKINGVPKK